LEPFGQGNPEPVFSAQAVRLMAPPKILKDKHVKLKLAAGISDPKPVAMSAVAGSPTPRCHPDAAEINRQDRYSITDHPLAAENPESRIGNSRWRRNITFDALGWHMAERLQSAKLLAGDTLDIAFTIGHNDHPEYGGLELSLRDFRTPF
jgi:single-stranded-DNA-specific exonuclease